MASLTQWLACIDHLLCAREMPVQRSTFFLNPFHILENHGTEKLRSALKAHRQVKLGLEPKPALQQMASPPGSVSSARGI